MDAGAIPGGGRGGATQLPAGGVGAAGRGNVAQLPAAGNRVTAGQLPANRGVRAQQLPQQRPNWNQWSQNRPGNWQQAVNKRSNYWNNWSGARQESLNNFANTRSERWNNVADNRQDWISDVQDDRQDWRVDNREDWQNHREDMWDYRWDRADEVWDDVQDYHDDLFDDQWWGSSSWGSSYYPPNYSYPANPWWWWYPASWNTVSSIVSEPEPIYYDHELTVIVEGDQVYQNGQAPVPAAEYRAEAIQLATAVDQPPPPEPVAMAGLTSQTVEPAWIPLGVWALTQEEKGDAVMFFQISVNKEGVISGGYQNVMTGESKPIAGSVDKETQRVAWRIGDNTNTVIETGLFNLTEDVTTAAMHFGDQQTQTWLMVRLPAPEMPGVPTPVDTTIKRELPPVMGATTASTGTPAAPPAAPTNS